MEEGGMTLRSGARTPTKSGNSRKLQENALPSPSSSSKKTRKSSRRTSDCEPQTLALARKINFNSDEVAEGLSNERPNVEGSLPANDELTEVPCKNTQMNEEVGRKVNNAEQINGLQPSGNVQPADVPCEFVDDVRQLLRRRVCDFQAAPVLPSLEANKRQLVELLEHTVVHACNNSSLLLGPRGCGKSMILDIALQEMENKFPGKISVVRLNGLVHFDDRSAMKEIAKQLCIVHNVEFAKGAAFDENLRFLTVVLSEFFLTRKAIVFVLEEFDLFAQRPKQCLLYNLLNVLQSSSSQAALIGVSCRLDADQLLEKRVRSRFSQRKMLFLPASTDEVLRFLELLLLLPVNFSAKYEKFATLWNERTMKLLYEDATKQFLKSMVEVELSPLYIANIIFRSICDLEPGKSFGINIKAAISAHKQRPTFDSLHDLSVLEVCLLAAMKRLEAKEYEAYNFCTVYKEYKQLQISHNTCDQYSKQASLKAFEHLLERELIAYIDGKEHWSLSEVSPVKMLVSWEELHEELVDSSSVCPTALRQWFTRDTTG